MDIESAGALGPFNKSASLQTFSPLFRLPLELRSKIYRFLMRSEVTCTPFPDDPDDRDSSGYFALSSQLLLTCQAIYQETRTVLYMENSLKIFINWQCSYPSIHVLKTMARLPTDINIIQSLDFLPPKLLNVCTYITKFSDIHIDFSVDVLDPSFSRETTVTIFCILSRLCEGKKVKIGDLDLWTTSNWSENDRDRKQDHSNEIEHSFNLAMACFRNCKSFSINENWAEDYAGIKLNPHLRAIATSSGVNWPVSFFVALMQSCIRQEMIDTFPPLLYQPLAWIYRTYRTPLYKMEREYYRALLESDKETQERKRAAILGHLDRTFLSLYQLLLRDSETDPSESNVCAYWEPEDELDYESDNEFDDGAENRSDNYGREHDTEEGPIEGSVPLPIVQERGGRENTSPGFILSNNQRRHKWYQKTHKLFLNLHAILAERGVLLTKPDAVEKAVMVT